MTGRRMAALGRTTTTLAYGLAAPIVSFYLLRALGIDPLVALLAGAASTLLGLLVRLVRKRPLGGLDAMFGILTLLSLGVSLLDGSPRFLLAKDGLLTAASGLWFLASLRYSARPAGLLFGRPLMEPIMPTRRDWDEMWDNEPVFRRCWRVVTGVWSATLLLDAVVRVVTAYTLPIDVVPGLNGALWIALVLVLQIVTNVYFHLAGLFRILFDRSAVGSSAS
jgi:hypothetical protein